MNNELNQFGYPKHLSIAIKYSKDDLIMLTEQPISESHRDSKWLINNSVVGSFDIFPTFVSNYGKIERFTFELGGGWKIAFSRNTSTKEIGNVLLFSADKLIATYK